MTGESHLERPSTPLRWGIIGAGRFGRQHAQVLRQFPDVQLKVVCRRDPERLAAVVGELGAVQGETDFRAVVESPDLDAVTICTHWRDHFEVALAALQCGKHVLLEKPMASTAAECRQLVAAARESRGMLMVGHVCRFDPRVTLAKQAIEQGQIGRVVSMHAKRNLPIAPGSVRLDKISPLMGDGIHDADLMMWFLQETPTRVFAKNLRVENFQYPDIGWAMLEFGEQAVGVIETNWRLPPQVPTTIDARFEIAGTEGLITIDCAHTGLTILGPQGARQPDTVYWPRQHGMVVGALVSEVRYFVDCIRRGEPPTVITPEEAARAVEVMELAERAAATGWPTSFSE